jgi:hypothetical protein
LSVIPWDSVKLVVQVLPTGDRRPSLSLLAQLGAVTTMSAAMVALARRAS